MVNRLDFGTVLKEGFGYGMKNIPSLLGAIVLWLVTIWIPYVNVGTTIAIRTLPLQLSRGEIFSPLSIFDKKYYRYMGEYFLTSGFRMVGICGAATFLFFPAIAVSFAWSLAILLLLDKGLNAAEAIRLSNKLTYGNKWTMFFVSFVLGLVYLIVCWIMTLILRPLIAAVDSMAEAIMLGFFIVNLFLALLVAFMAFSMGCQASIYGTLSQNIEEQH
ncbi:MAG: hypothetical protein LBR26_07545 [Prevotella sp.]|jgi:hypothetical protein|nr:hypothetical protein [Prevotella sp.]